MKPPDDPKIWFPAKRYGYGWGWPCRWQGWVVMVAFTALVAGGGFVFLPGRPLGFLLHVIVMCAALSWVCLKRGEKPRWRGGDDDAR